jgi:hypothetical protein
MQAGQRPQLAEIPGVTLQVKGFELRAGRNGRIDSRAVVLASVNSFRLSAT